jgi:hypothetical protein
MSDDGRAFQDARWAFSMHAHVFTLTPPHERT